MTIRVTVKNEDSRETAVIAVTTQPLGAGATVIDDRSEKLKGGESREFYVHSTQHLLVREVGQ